MMLTPRSWWGVLAPRAPAPWIPLDLNQPIAKLRERFVLGSSWCSAVARQDVRCVRSFAPRGVSQCGAKIWGCINFNSLPF